MITARRGHNNRKEDAGRPFFVQTKSFVKIEIICQYILKILTVSHSVLTGRTYKRYNDSRSVIGKSAVER